MGKSLAEASGQTQGQLSPTAPVKMSTAARTAEKINQPAVDFGDGARDSAQSRESRAVKLLAKFVGANKPRSSRLYKLQQSLF
jgi:hypothetical protein